MKQLLLNVLIAGNIDDKSYSRDFLLVLVSIYSITHVFHLFHHRFTEEEEKELLIEPNNILWPLVRVFYFIFEWMFWRISEHFDYWIASIESR